MIFNGYSQNLIVQMFPRTPKIKNAKKHRKSEGLFVKKPISRRFPSFLAQSIPNILDKFYSKKPSGRKYDKVLRLIFESRLLSFFETTTVKTICRFISRGDIWSLLHPKKKSEHTNPHEK